MPADPAAAKALFLEAAALTDPAARAALLDDRCGGDDGLRARVLALLAANDLALANEGTQSFGDADVTVEPEAAPTADFPGKDEHVGAVIGGKYTLVEAVGEGGMGSVWRARQTEPVTRFVAVKLIKAGMDSRSVLARFEAERQALALMDHPNIAKVMDGGIHDGRPFFVMELVKGAPITDYCDAAKLTPKQRLELFVQACQAIQHAHLKGVIHRDIKPSNVLVALYDDRPVVKVIDFGVAKATGGTLSEKTIDTGFGGVVGTPQYMSPEQATFNNLDIDTRSDVYALGVLLYELLTGTPPFSRKELQEKGLLEILRIVREEEPPRPSSKLSTSDALPSLSAFRGTEPRKLTELLRNELDWIVMKALEKDRTRRYETANGFAADVQRYLSGEAVSAHPPSTAYRMKKFVLRNRGQVIAVSLVVLALVAGVVGTSLGLLEARRQTEFAREQMTEAKKQAGIARANEAKMAEALGKAEFEELRAELHGFQLSAWNLKLFTFRNTVLKPYLEGVEEDADRWPDDQAERTETQKTTLETIAKQWLVFTEREETDEGSRAVRTEAHYRLACVRHALGRWEEARREYEKAMALWKELATDFPAEHEYRLGVARTHANLGLLLARLGKLAEAEEHSHIAVVRFQKLGDHANATSDGVNLGGCYCNLGNVAWDKGKHADSVEWFSKAIDQLRYVGDNRVWYVIGGQILRESHLGRARAYDALGKHAEAVADWSRVVELSLPRERPAARANRVSSNLRAGRGAEAVAEVAELTKLPSWDADHWYEFACVYSLASGKIDGKKQEYVGRAMELLSKAVKGGYTNHAHMKKDTDLGPLRDLDDFKKLLVELEEKFPSPKEVAPPPKPVK